SCRATAGRSTASRRSRSCARTARTWSTWRSTPRCRWRAAPERSAPFTRRTSSTSRGDEHRVGGGLVDLDVAQYRLAQADLVAVGEHGVVYSLAVEERPVEAAVIEQHGQSVALDDQRVAAGYGAVVDLDLGGHAPPQPGHPVGKREQGAVADLEIAAGGGELCGDRVPAGFVGQG